MDVIDQIVSAFDSLTETLSALVTDSPWTYLIVFAMVALDVLFPILPYGFAPSSFLALPFSILFAGAMLALMATVVAMLSGISWRQKSAEMVVSGFAAAGLSYGFGLLMRSLFGIGG